MKNEEQESEYEEEQKQESEEEYDHKDNYYQTHGHCHHQQKNHMREPIRPCLITPQHHPRVTDLLTYPPTRQTYLRTICLSYLLSFLPIYSPTYAPTDLYTYLATYLPSQISSQLLTYLPPCLRIYFLSYLATSLFPDNCPGCSCYYYYYRVFPSKFPGWLLAWLPRYLATCRLARVRPNFQYLTISELCIRATVHMNLL